MFRNNFFYKNSMGEKIAPLLLQKEKPGSANSDVSKVFFPGTGKITTSLFSVVKLFLSEV